MIKMIADVIRQAQKMHREAVESMYTGMATITEQGKIKDEKTKLTKFDPKIVLRNQPCRLSYEKQQNTVQSDSAAAIIQTTKLFISPDIVIKPGSKITVTQAGVTADFSCSGQPAVYPSHQEMVLIPFKEWA